MKNTVAILLLFTFNITIAQQSYKDGEKTHLWGKITVDDLKKEPYADWYQASYEKFSHSMEQKKFEQLQNVEVKIFLGTWCGDTQNWLPKFIHLWENAGLSKEQLNLIALHSIGDLYKEGPDKEELGYNIHRVPAFIFERDGKEIGRIVESPMTDLETDVAQIAAGIPSEPRYKAVSYLQEYFETADADSLFNDYTKLASELWGKTQHIGELATFGNKLYTQGDKKQSEFVFNLNMGLYKYHPYPYTRMGMFWKEEGDYKKAKSYYDQALEIDPKYKSALSSLEEVKGLLANQK